MANTSFAESFKFAYNTTIESVPVFGALYEKIPVLTNEEALRQGLMRLKTLLTMFRNLDPPKALSALREIARGSAVLTKVLERNCPELVKMLNPRGGKVPRTYLGKVFAQDCAKVSSKLFGQITREMRKAWPKMVRALLGLDAEGAKLVMENVLSKSSKILAKSPELEWAWLAGWGGLVVGSTAYAAMDQLGINQSIQGSMQWVFREWYGIDVIEADTARMSAVILRKKLRVLKDTAFLQAQKLGVEVPPNTIQMMHNLILQLDAAETQAHGLLPTFPPSKPAEPGAQKAVDKFEETARHGSNRI